MCFFNELIERSCQLKEKHNIMKSNTKQSLPRGPSFFFFFLVSFAAKVTDINSTNTAKEDNFMLNTRKE